MVWRTIRLWLVAADQVFNQTGKARHMYGGTTDLPLVARTRIAFTSDRDSTETQSKELYIVDYDGFNPRRVTVNRSLNIVPAWSRYGQSLAYVSYRQGTPLVYLARIFEGRSEPNITGEREGSQAFAPAFSPDGRSLASVSASA